MAGSDSPRQVTHLLEHLFRDVDFERNRAPKGGTRTLQDVGGNVLMMKDSWPSNHAYQIMDVPSARLLAFRDVGEPEPPGSCAPRDFPSNELRAIRGIMQNALQNARINIEMSGCPKGRVQSEMQELGFRVWRWCGMWQEAEVCKFWRVRFDGVHAAAVKILEISQFAYVVNAPHTKRETAAWCRTLERMELMARDWEARRGD